MKFFRTVLLTATALGFVIASTSMLTGEANARPKDPRMKCTFDDDNPDWVHVSFVHDGVNRGRCLKACRDDEGKTYYEVIFGKGL